jgi:hypothetical protein
MPFWIHIYAYPYLVLEEYSPMDLKREREGERE